MGTIKIPKGYRRKLKSISRIEEVNRWATDVDMTVTEALRAISDLARQVNLMSNQATEQTSLSNHAASHLPNTGLDPLTTAIAGTIQPDDAAAIGTANAFSRSDHRHAIVAAAAAALGTSNLEGTATSFSRSDHQHIFPPSLRSVAAVAGDLFTLTSDGTDETLTLSRANADLILADQAGLTMLRMFPGNALDEGIYARSAAFGMNVPNTVSGVPGPQQATILYMRENTSTRTATILMDASMTLDSANVFGDAVVYDISIGAGLTIPAGQNINAFGLTVAGNSGATVHANGYTAARGMQINVNPTIAAGSAPWTEVYGINIGNYRVTGVNATRAYGIRVGIGAGTTVWAGMFAGDVQITGSNKLRLGGTGTTQAGDAFYRSAAQRLKWQLNGSDVLSLENLTDSGLAPTTNGGLSLGLNGMGWADLWIKDTSAAFEDRIVFTSSTALTADRILTVDVVDGARTVKIKGNPTLDDWFDQAVKTTSSPTLAGLTISDAGNMVLGTTTGTKIGTATTQKLGFFNKAPVVQPATTGTTTGFTQNVGTEVRDDSTFTGNTGSAAYTIGDIVKAMKDTGLMAA